jgi:hypothetical protein
MYIHEQYPLVSKCTAPGFPNRYYAFHAVYIKNIFNIYYIYMYVPTCLHRILYSISVHVV